MLRIFTISLGCPKNRVDTERMLASLSRLDSEVRAVESVGQAQVVLVNTCAFIEPAVQESLRAILDLADEMGDTTGQDRPVLAVVGCLPGRYGDELRVELPEVDLFLRPGEIGVWPERLAVVLRARGVGAALVGDPVPGAPGRVLSTGPAFAYLKVSEGCNHACSFCTIPAIRGPHVSRPLGELKAEALELLAQGVKELVLVGQDVTAYGRDMTLGVDLKRLVEVLLPLPGLARLRLMYLYPAGLDRELLHFLAQACEDSPLLPYFDVPLQHAHPEILSAMGRPFARDPRRVVDLIREAIPGAALRTSLIVGFPGEKERHFQALKEFVAQIRFRHVGVFPYWPEEGTPAAALPGQVAPGIKERRRSEIMELQAEISAEMLSPTLGEDMEVLVEAPHPEWPGLHTGRVWFQGPEVDGVTYVSGPGVAPGALVTARIEDAGAYDLTALVQDI